MRRPPEIPINGGRRFVYMLIGTNDDDAGNVWRRMTASQRERDADAREHLAAWALEQALATVGSLRICRVSAARDLVIKGPISVEVTVEGFSEGALHHADRIFFTMLLRRRELIDFVLAEAAAHASVTAAPSPPVAPKS
jgi:hypothetical protein